MGLDDSGDPFYPTGQPISGVYLAADLVEAQKLGAYAPAPADAQAAQPWWVNTVMYGITKAIDNTFPSDTAYGIQGNTRPGSFAGANGRTYDQRGSVNAPPTLAGIVGGSGVGGLPLTTLVVLAVIGYLILK